MEYLESLRLSENLIFDSHAHYDDAKFDSCRDELLALLPENGVCAVVTCGCDGGSSRAALALAQRYDYLYAAVGIHPENLESGTSVEEIERLSRAPKCVAIGEIGLDYYWDKEHCQLQQEVFERQLELANRLGLPVIVHDRDAHADTLALLKKHRPRGVVHCFSGSPEMAREILALGMYIGVGGVITFKNARRLPEVVRLLPEDRLLVETDCPYLAPEPFRGRLCHSGMIVLTARRIAELRGCTPREVLISSRDNAKKLFGIHA